MFKKRGKVLLEIESYFMLIQRKEISLLSTHRYTYTMHSCTYTDPKHLPCKNVVCKETFGAQTSFMFRNSFDFIFKNMACCSIMKMQITATEHSSFCM